MQSSPAVFHPMAWLRFAANYVEHQRLLLQQQHRDLAVARLKKIFHRTGQMLNQQTGHPWVRQWRLKYATQQQIHNVGNGPLSWSRMDPMSAAHIVNMVPWNSPSGKGSVPQCLQLAAPHVAWVWVPI